MWSQCGPQEARGDAMTRPLSPDVPGEASPARTAVFTICSKNYLPQARILIASLKTHCPHVEMTAFIADEVENQAEIAAFLGASVVAGRELDLPTYDDMAMRYDIVEFNTALKPAAFDYVFETGVYRAIYLDPDIEVMRPLSELDELFSSGAEAVVTPHITKPLDMVKNPTELKIIRTGIYNLGFLGLRNTPGARRFVRWWGDRMPSECRVDLDAGIFVDQKYVDLLPSYVANTTVLRHPGYNVAYWNLAHRPLTQGGDGQWNADGERLAFMHYSGVRPNERDVVSVHQDRLQIADLGEGASLFENYRARLREARVAFGQTSIQPNYAYGSFASGEEITPLLRQVYARAVPPNSAPYAEVFDAASNLLTSASTGLTHRASNLISPVMSDLWLRKPHLQAAFDIYDPSEAEAFALWFAQTGHKEFKVSPDLVPIAAQQLAEKQMDLRSRWALLTLKMIELGKKTAFLYPKPVRRAATRTLRKVLPVIVKSMRGSRRRA